MSGFSKAERLYEQNLISRLFADGRRFFVNIPSGRLRITYLLVDGKSLVSSDIAGSCHGNDSLESPSEGDSSSLRVKTFRPSCKVMVSAPKKQFRHAVDRNRIKRLLRESYRFYKEDFVSLSPEGKVLLLSFQYTGEKSPSLSEVQDGVGKVLRMLYSRLSHA